MLNIHPDVHDQVISAVSMDGATLSVVTSGCGVQMHAALPLTFCIPQVALTDFD